ncbi:MAG: hypothetical protein AB1646_16455 [Thermodesulfobacteriota bacterium]
MGKRVQLGCLFIFLVFPIFVPAASAWEFQMEGQVNWYSVRFSQLGHSGFFGPYGVDKGAGTTTANLNFWEGEGILDKDFASSADAGWSAMWVKFWPTLKINEAIRVQAQYRIGMYGDPTGDNDYWTQGALGSETAISEGKWTLFWVTAQTPWGAFGVGKRRWLFGTGLQYDGSDSASTESLTFVAPYGPLKIGFGFHPWRFAGSSPQPSTYTVVGVPPGYQDPYDLGGFQHFNRADFSGDFSRDLLGFVTYASGGLQVGVLGVYGDFHIGPEALLGPNQFSAQDTQIFHGSSFLKYQNGRLSCNAEAAWLYWTDRFQGQRAQAMGTNARDIEQWRFMTEIGLSTGPAKTTLFYAWQPGPDRRNGMLIGKQQAAFLWHPTYDRFLSNFSVFRPYAYMFSYVYGSGLGAYNLTVDGYVRDASTVAARLDYAVAANLNLFGTAFWAERTSHGYPWGFIGPNDLAFNGIPVNGNMGPRNFRGAVGAPNIPDRSLGYEFDAGFEWQLLEGWSLSGTFCYWQPGKWFTYACVDRSVPSWNVQTSANAFGTRPDKTINPVVGGEISMAFRF